MSFQEFIQLVFGVGFATFGFLMKFILSKLDEGHRKMAEIESELARQKQQANDATKWMNRMEDKIDVLIERQMRKR
jgi:hypothetical protein